MLAVTRHLRAETSRLRRYFPCGQTKKQSPGLAMVDWEGRVKAWLSLRYVVVLGPAAFSVHLVLLLLLLLPVQLLLRLLFLPLLSQLLLPVQLQL